MRRYGFTLIEVLVAVGVLALILGGSLIALERGQMQTALAGNAQGGSRILALIAERLAAGNPRYAPNQPDSEKTWAYGALAELLTANGLDLANPGAYRLAVQRGPDAQDANGLALARYTVQVCWRAPTPQGEACLERPVLGAPPSRTDTLTDPTAGQGTASLPPAGGTIQLVIDGGGASRVDVTLTGPSGAWTITQPGAHTLTDLPGGGYSVTARPVSDGLYAYRPQVSGGGELIAGGGLAFTVAYRAVTGALEVAVTGPDADAPRVVVSGPSGYQTVLAGAGTHTLPFLEPGTYTIQPQPYEAGGYRYAGRADPTPVTVAAGQTATVNVAYGPNTGNLEIDATGLPPGAAPAYSVAGPNGYTARIGGDPAALKLLPPGAYGISADSLALSGFTYAATLTPNPAQVAAGQTTRVQARYAPITGGLDLVLNPPANAQPQVSLRGPNGFAGTYAQTQRLTDLEPGQYTATAANLVLDGYTYAAQYTNNPAQVVAGQVARLEVRWAAADGKLRVTIDGAPPGGAPRVAVQGDGFGTTLTQSALLTGLAPGKYTVTPEPFRYGAYTYAGVAAPADPTVFAGSETTVGVRYAPQTGALAVTLTPPPGGSPAVVVTGPNGYRNTLTGSATLEDLEPGAYALEAPPVTIDGIRYAPRFAPDANPTVTAGQTAQVEVAYAAENALLEVGIEPAPNGQAAVEVRDAAGRVVATLAQSQTLDLEPGQYTLVAQPVWVGPDVYRPTPDTVTVDLAAGAREAASFTYAAWSGTLEVTVTGLPQGAQADVVVTGPNNYRKKLTGSATLTGLAPGQYTLAPNPVTAGADRYEAAAQTVAVASGQTTRAAVRYARATATLRVDATGLPAGVTADVRLNGPDPDLPPRVTVPPQRVLAGLEPGSYTLAAPDVTAGGFTYRASPATQAVTLARGDDRTVTVAYRAATARLVLEVAAPAGVGVDVTLTGPNGFRRDYRTAGRYVLEGLEPGQYTLTARETQAGGQTYAPDVQSETFALAAGDDAARTVAYAQRTGTLVLEVAAPAGVQPSVTVTGPNNYQKKLTGSATLTGLEPGQYTVTAASVSLNGFTYAATPDAQTVQLQEGGRVTARLTYAAVDGKLSVTVTGLPGGAQADVVVTGPGGYRKKLTGSATLAGLEPGTYTIAARDVRLNGFTYAATPDTQTVQVAAGQTASAGVAYGATSGALRVAITGLPSGAQADVTVTGPGGYRKKLTAGATLTGLAPGTYTVAANAVSANGFTYAPSPASQTVQVQAGRTASASVAYAATDGKLAVTVSGLPRGVSASVTVTGPNNYRRTLTGSATLTGLAPGTYTVAANAVSANGFTYRPSPKTQTVQVAAGQTARASVAYAAADGKLSVTISGLPSGVQADVVVTGPGGYRKKLTGSATLTGLAPGKYTITANAVNANNATYAPDRTRQTVTVTAGQTASASVRYQVGAKYGTLTVRIDRHQARVQGPGLDTTVRGDNDQAFETQTFTVATGTYQAQASVVGPWNAGSGVQRRWYPAVSGSPASVGWNQSKTITIDYKLQERRRYCSWQFLWWCLSWSWSNWRTIGD